MARNDNITDAELVCMKIRDEMVLRSRERAFQRDKTGDPDEMLVLDGRACEASEAVEFINECIAGLEK